MAAGLSLAGEEMIEPFRRALNDNSTLTEEDFVEKVVIDVPMPITYITKNLIRQLSLLEPFGKGNTKTAVRTERTDCIKLPHFWKE